MSFYACVGRNQATSDLFKQLLKYGPAVYVFSTLVHLGRSILESQLQFTTFYSSKSVPVLLVRGLERQKKTRIA